MSKRPCPQVLVIGIDGATWDLILPWAEQGHLPHLQALMEQGSWGDLVSTIPPVTAPAWCSFMTGRNPGKHGIFDFTSLCPPSYQVNYLNFSSNRASTLWSILSQKGKRVGALNVPLTFPPPQVNGYIIAGMGTPEENSDFVYPHQLRSEIEASIGKIPLDLHHLAHMHSDAARDQALQAFVDIEKVRTRMALYLQEKHPCDLMMLVFTATDQVQHHFWHYMDPHHHHHDPVGAEKYRDAIFRIYRSIDQCIGELVEHMGPETTVIAMSDHGAGPVSRKRFCINLYLEQVGLLKFASTNSQSWLRQGATFLDRQLRRWLTQEQKKKLAALFPWARGRLESFITLGAIDWSQTKAFATEISVTSPNIWINSKGRFSHGTVEPGSQYEEVVETLIEALYELKDPLTGEQVVKKVLRKEEIYGGPHLESAPDLVLDWWSEDSFVSSPSFPKTDKTSIVSHASDRLKSGAEWSGTHRLNGIALLKGPAFRPQFRFPEAQITDLAPTILHLLNIPIPSDMDGQVLMETMESSYILSHPPIYEQEEEGARALGTEGKLYTATEAQKVEERLRDLGYLG